LCYCGGEGGEEEAVSEGLFEEGALIEIPSQVLTFEMFS
jgi:hypothetical protein